MITMMFALEYLLAGLGETLAALMQFVLEKIKDPLFIIAAVAVVFAVIALVGIIRKKLTKSPEEDFFNSLNEKEDDAK